MARQMPAAPEQITRRSHLGRINIRVGQPPSAQPPGDLLGIDLVVFGFAPMNGRHGEGVPEDKRNACAGTEGGKPVPGEEAFDTDDEVLPVGGDSFEKRFRTSRHGAVHQDLTILVQPTEVQGAGMQVDAAGKWVLLRVEAPEVSSSLLSDSLPLSADHRGRRGRGPQ